jgi:hypothetical protein
MQWKPFLSPPRICRFFAKQMVMWATSPTFGASSLNKWKVGPTFEQYFVQSLRTLKHKILKEKKTMQGTTRQWQRYLCAFWTFLFFLQLPQMSCLKGLTNWLPGVLGGTVWHRGQTGPSSASGISYPVHSVAPFGVGAKWGHRVHWGSVTQGTRWHHLA